MLKSVPPTPRPAKPQDAQAAKTKDISFVCNRSGRPILLEEYFRAEYLKAYSKLLVPPRSKMRVAGRCVSTLDQLLLSHSIISIIN